jgi:signal transduction histidine kinase
VHERNANTHPTAGPPRTGADRARLLADVTLAVLLAAGLVVQAVAIAVSWGGRYWVVECATGALVSAAAILRRHAATLAATRAGAAGLVGVAGVGLVVAAGAIVVARVVGLPGEPSPVTVVGLGVLVGAAVRRLPAVPAGVVAAGGLVVAVGSRVAALPTASGMVPTLAAAGWLVAVAGGLGLRASDARRRAVTEAVRRDERLDLARELHDVVAHHITGIVLQAQAARLIEAAGGKASGGEALVGSLAGIEAAGTEALAAMRRVVGVLRDGGDGAPNTPAALGVERLGELVRRFAGHGFVVRLTVPGGGDGAGWPPEVSGAVYRVVQESLTNVSRHATRAGAVSVAVVRGAGGVTVEVSDDAPAAPARLPHRGGYGLVGMRERVETLGGTLRAGPRPTGGWSVHATLPLAPGDSR